MGEFDEDQMSIRRWRSGVYRFFIRPFGTPGRVQPPAPEPEASAPRIPVERSISEIATALWYLKTKHFKAPWEVDEVDSDDPRARRAIRRLNRAVTALEELGVEVHDPTGERYPAGAQNMMKILEWIHDKAASMETVTETVAPIVYFRQRIARPGEVYVTGPPEPVEAVATGVATASDDGGAGEAQPSAQIEAEASSAAPVEDAGATAAPPENAATTDQAGDAVSEDGTDGETGEATASPGRPVENGVEASDEHETPKD